MWLYEKKLEYPVKIKNPNPALAKAIISQLGGPDGELGAATRYLQQRYSMPSSKVKGILTDIGTEELAHIEMISAILYQLTRNLSICDIKKSGFDTYFVDHTTGVYPQAASGVPFSTATLQVTGDALADLYEDLAAEQKARLSYDNILRLIDDPDVRDPIIFLREREIVHFQRFGEANHTDLSRFYPLWAAAYRGYWHRNSIFQNVGMTANSVTPIPQIYRYVSHCEPASAPAHHRQCDTPAASPGGCDTPDALPSFRTNCDLCSSPAVSLP